MRPQRFLLLLFTCCQVLALGEVRAVIAYGADGATQQRRPLLGITTFPYDKSIEAITRTTKLVQDNSSLWVVQLDFGICWDAALKDQAWPSDVRRDWDDRISRIPRDRPLFVSVAPLSENREHPATDFGGQPAPDWVNRSQLNAAAIQKAYANYLSRVVREFRPDYLNVGQEAGVLAYQNPEKWEQFTQTYRYVRRELKRKHPALKVGISFGLHSLMAEGVAARCQSVIEDSDFLGVSFYPHLSPFGEKRGLAPLPSGEQRWNGPLKWLANFASKPIAICETGLGSGRPLSELADEGSEELQKEYLHDLLTVADQDDYEFVVWFCAVDFYELLGKLPAGSEIAQLWVNTGMIDRQLRPKLAWEEWQQRLGDFR